MRREYREYMAHQERMRLLVWQDKARKCNNPVMVTLAVVMGGAALICAIWGVIQ